MEVSYSAHSVLCSQAPCSASQLLYPPASMPLLHRELLLCFCAFVTITSIFGIYKTGPLNRDRIRNLQSYLPSIYSSEETLRPPVSQQQQTSSHVTIGNHTTLPTKVHTLGFTMLDHLYLRNGTFYVLISDQSKFPPLRNMASKLLEPGQDLEPTDKVC